jgi:hypothetical protein
MGLKNQQSSADNQHQEFNIQPEDFPALPRPQSVHNKSTSHCFCIYKYKFNLKK